MAQYFGVYREGGAQLQSLAVGVDAVTQGTASTAATDIELRVAAADANGHQITKKDVITALEKLKVAILNAEVSPFPII
jgi:hypothetical protein